MSRKSKLRRLACLTVIAAFANAISRPLVKSDPAIVGAKASSLVAEFMNEQPLPAGTSIQIIVPDQATVEDGPLTCHFKGYLNRKDVSCKGEAWENSLKVELWDRVPAFKPIQITFEKAFNTPMSTEQTDSFQVLFLNDFNQAIEMVDTDLYLFQIDPAPLQQVSIEPVGDLTVGGNSQAVVSLRTVNPIPAGGALQVKLPKWNPDAQPAFQESFIYRPEGTEAPLCRSIALVDAAASCEVHFVYNDAEDVEEDFLTLIDAFPDGVEAESEVSFVLNYLRGPISMTEVPMNFTTYAGVKKSINSVELSGQIDTGIASFQATQVATIDPVMTQVTAADSTVQEYSTFYIKFSVSVPISPGSRLLIKMPEEIPIGPGDVQRVQGWGGIFGAAIELSQQVDNNERTIRVEGSQYSQENQESTIQIESLQSPPFVDKTSSFQLTVSDNQGGLIATISEGMIYTPTPGLIQDVTLVATKGTQIQTISDLILTFTPPHKVVGDSYMSLILPSSIDFSCNSLYTKGLVQNPECIEIFSNQLKLSSIFKRDEYLGNQALSVGFSNRIMPASSQPIKGIVIQIYQYVGNESFLVDQINDPEFMFFEMQSVEFFGDSLKSTSDTTFTQTDLTFYMTVASEIPKDAIAQITFPPEVTISGSLEKMSELCEIPSDPSFKPNCEFQVGTVQKEDSTGKALLQENTIVATVRGLFRQSLQSQDDFDFRISANITTPISVKTSQPFVFKLLDSSGREINYSNSTLTLTMAQGIDIGALELVSESYVVGDWTEHTISFKTPVPLVNGTRVYINLPRELGTPIDDSFSVSSPQLAQESQNYIVGKRVTVVVALDPQVGQIEKDDIVSFRMGPIQNPSSMAPSSPYSVQIDSDDGYEQASQQTTGIKMRNQKPAQITDFEFEAFDQRHGALTTVTISWTNTQDYPLDLSLVINFDPAQIYPKLPQVQSSTPCLFRGSAFVDCAYFDDYILVSNILLSPQTAGQQMSLTINSMYINVFEPIETNSWTMTAYAGKYEIDRIDSGLTFNFECKYPCMTCSESPEHCLSCNDYDLGTYMILYNDKCYSECPEGTYEENFQCKPCNFKCKACEKTNPEHCTACDPESDFPFLDGSTCTKECFFGTYGNFASGECELCAPPCQTCVGEATACLTCDQTISEKFHYDFECHEQCPFATVADVTKRTTVCEDCSPNCNECVGTKDHCKSCPEGKILNKVGNEHNCVQKCPENVSVMKQVNGELICQPCDDNCLTCAFEPTTCTSCRQNLNLNEDTGVCVLECPDDNKSVAFEGECVECDSNCMTCQGTRDNCLECWPGTHWYNKKCVEECPTVEGYKYSVPKGSKDNRCVIDGLYCKFGWKPNDAGTGCQIDLVACPPPNGINYDHTKCIPGFDEWVPFPIWIIWIAPTLLLLLISKIKAKETKFVSNWLALLSIAEIATMIYTFHLAYQFGILPTTALLGFSIAIHYGINLFFLLVFYKQVKQTDMALAHWIQYNQKMSATLTVIGTVFNFKAYRLFFGRLFGRDEFNAPMESPIVFYSPFNLSSLINMVFVKLVVLFACVFALYHIRWGYQLVVECYELLAIEILMLVLSVIEYLQLRQMFQRKDYHKIDPKKVQAAAVMGFNDLSDDEDSRDIIDPAERAKRGKPKALKTIHQMHKVLHKLDVTELKKEYGRSDFLPEDDIRGMAIMRRDRRGCVSFRGLPQVNPWDDDSGDEQNFISEPNSPRSKQLVCNQQFIQNMMSLRAAQRSSALQDNCYSEARHPTKRRTKSAKLGKNVKVQTNLMELLGLDDLFPKADSEGSSESENAERGMSLDEGYSTGTKKRWIKDNVRIKRKVQRLSKSRQAEVPKYEHIEILGEFMKDELGYNLMVRSRGGKLNDMYGRRVNRRGYCIDDKGNIVTRGGVLIFYANELSQDDEIPAPYYKRKSSKPFFRIVDFADYKKLKKQHKLSMQDQYIEKEFQRLKRESQMLRRNQDGTKSAERLGGRGSGFNRSTERIKSGGKSHGKSSQMDDESYGNIFQPIVPKSKNQLVGNQSQSSIGKTRVRSEHSQTMKATKSKERSHSSGLGKSFRGSRDRTVSRKSRKSRHTKNQPSTDHEANTGVDLSNKLVYLRSESEMKRHASAGSSRGEVSYHHDQLVDLKFDTKAKISKKSRAKKRVISAQPLKNSDNVYIEERLKLEQAQMAINQEEKLLANVAKFNNYMDRERRRIERQNLTQDIQPNLRHHNLGAVYGRVKQRFNRHMRQTGVTLRQGPRKVQHQNQDLFSPLKDTYLFPHEAASQHSDHAFRERPMETRLQQLQRIYSQVRVQPEHRVRSDNSTIAADTVQQKSSFKKVRNNSVSPVVFPEAIRIQQQEVQSLSNQEVFAMGEDGHQSQQSFKRRGQEPWMQGWRSRVAIQGSKGGSREGRAPVAGAGAYDLLHGKFI